MRPLIALLAIILVAAALSGCIQADPRDDGSTANDTPRDTELEGHYTLPLTGTTWSSKNLAVLIVPPAYGEVADPDQINPYDGVYMRAVEDSIIHWQESMSEHGSEDIQQIELHVQVLGRDTAPGQINEVDILVINPLKPPVLAPFSGVGIGLPSGHCVAYNSIDPTVDAYDWIFALSGHEFGHCLGMGHPTDHDPWLDLMSYTDIFIPDGETMPPLECVSNMNLQAVHEAFAPAFGREPQGPIEFPKAEYEIYECWDRFLEE
jgi:hypothetical protein